MSIVPRIPTHGLYLPLVLRIEDRRYMYTPYSLYVKVPEYVEETVLNEIVFGIFTEIVTPRVTINYVSPEFDIYCDEGFSDDCCLFKAINYKPFDTLRDYYLSLLKTPVYRSMGVKECDYEFHINHWLSDYPGQFDMLFTHTIGGDNKYFEPNKLFDINIGIK